MSTIKPQEPWASAMIAVGAADPRREGVASWNRLGEIADVHTSTITGFIAGDRTPSTRTIRKIATTEPTWGPLKTAASRRSLSIGPATLQALGERGDGLVFTNAQGRPMSRQNLSEAWRHVMPALGRSGWHDQR